MIDPFILSLSVWALGALISIGVWREMEGGWDEDMAFVILWPIMLAVAVVAGAGWSLMWIGRGPVKLYVYVKNRNKLPKAVAREKS